MSGRYEKKREKKPVSAGKTVLIVVAVVLVLVAAAGIAGVVYYNRMLGKLNQVEVGKITYTQPLVQETEGIKEEPANMEQTEAATEEAATEPPHVASREDYLNILLVGQAAREGEAERFADTMILCTINTYEKTLTMTSLLRDSFVKMPDYKGHYGGRIKLTTIYHLGGMYGDGVAGSMELMNQTLYDNFGIEVDYDVEIDFEAFIKVVDRLGGVYVELTDAEAAYLNADTRYVRREIPSGPFVLEGAEALSYARMRKAEGDAESDIKRTARQRAVISGIFYSLRQAKLSDIQAIIDEVLPMVTVSMNSSEITKLLTQLLPMLPEMQIIGGGTCPAEYKGEMVDIYKDGMMHSILRFDTEKTKKTMREITLGEVPAETTASN